ncbi:MAG: dienelactone hydrolase family protein [Myxococcales bacterium]|nr:dienelactone hydrolase family protein [Deltaproteobacteria bacterium]NND28576.1 dienelactone hydrolase family protein [Myxococcales bacterium]MBT8480786.1 dienelactone hydrolase family protein [Deltaproteobacteria bacterium]NNK06552.1 dienelactone hydrolase family protein [Myxococcales bacterium]NNL23653.1 dienelactone hydrolase family protein [Myxococcales bacterium]
MAHRMVESISISVPSGGTHEAALALPVAGESLFSGVVIIHDIYGFSADLHRHCQRFADAGYVAIAPDLYRGRHPACVVKTIRSMTTGRGFAYEVIEAARHALAARDDVDATRIAVAGFCMGGGFALLAAADQSYAVAAPFYGAVPHKASRLKNLCPTLAQYGAMDTPFLPHAKRLVEHLEELGIEHEVLIHENVGHSFMNQHEFRLAALGRHTPLRAFYDPDTEAQAWSKLLDFFERHLKRPRLRGGSVSPIR